MQRPGSRFFTVFAVALATAFLLAGSLQDATAARSSKPKEIVVVGSKVKEVIREAGLRSDGELVQAVSDKVHELLGSAVRRAARNRRAELRFFDISCWSDDLNRTLLVRPGLVRKLLAERGFVADREFVQALSDTLHLLLGDATERAVSNKRATVRPYDL
jgi:hypothetical protein